MRHSISAVNHPAPATRRMPHEEPLILGVAQVAVLLDAIGPTIAVA